MTIAIIGSRGINDVKFIEKHIRCHKFDKIISGGAKGVDTIARLYAIKNNIPIDVIYPDYVKYKKAAPIIRNKEIIERSDYILLFWDGNSKGTKFCIDYTKKINKPICLVLAH